MKYAVAVRSQTSRVSGMRADGLTVPAGLETIGMRRPYGVTRLTV